MMRQMKQVFVTAFGCVLVLASSGLYAESLSVEAKNPASQPLTDAVNRIVQVMSYVDTSLLSDEYIEKVEASENYEAIAILHRSLSDRELIEAQINQGRFEEAYVAMRTIENRIAVSIKRSWANERAHKKDAGRLIAGI